VYVKGAPELILEMCANTLQSNQVHKMERGEREDLLGEVENMARVPLRVIGFGYIDMSRDQWE